MIRTYGVVPEGNIVDVQDSYSYLGIPQANGNHEETAWRSATAKYLQGWLSRETVVGRKLFQCVMEKRREREMRAGHAVGPEGQINFLRIYN